MSKAKIFLGLGVWVTILPYLGFPYSWKNILFTITGLVLAYIAYTLYREHKIKTMKTGGDTFDNFQENKNFNEEIINTDENNFN